MKKKYLTYAISKTTKQLAFVNHVPNGNECGCICPHCGQPLCAKNNGEERVPHFSHINNKDCEGAIESALHMMAKEVLEKNKCVLLPSLSNPKKRELLHFDYVEVESHNMSTNLRPDSIGHYDNGKTMWIEFKKTHAVDDTKKDKIILLRQNCIEIDLKDCELNPNSVQEYITKNINNRKWICNVDYGEVESREFLIKESYNRICKKFNISEKFEISISNDFICNEHFICNYYVPLKCNITKDTIYDIKSYGYSQIVRCDEILDNSFSIEGTGNTPIFVNLLTSGKSTIRKGIYTINIVLDDVKNILDLSNYPLSNNHTYKYKFEKRLTTLYQSKELSIAADGEVESKLAADGEVESKLWKFYKSESGKCHVEKVSCKEPKYNTDNSAFYFKEDSNIDVVKRDGLEFVWSCNRKHGCFCCLCKYHSTNKYNEIFCKLKKSKCDQLFPLMENSLECKFFEKYN